MSKIKLLNDPALRKKCEPINEFNTDYIENLLNEMHEVMKQENGAGLAANQIGHIVQIFILKRDDTYEEYINPTILAQYEEVDFIGEGCLSIPGTSATTQRYRKLTLSWVNKKGTTNTGNFEDFDAFAIQHEMDHLNGKLYIDQFGAIKRDMIINKHKKFLRMIKKGG